MATELSLDVERLRSAVARLFEMNRVRQVRPRQGPAEVTYHAPSLPRENPRLPWRRLLLPWKVAYPHQWFWDSTAHVIVLRHLDLEEAREELRSLLRCQEPSGFIPHLIWNPSRRHWVDRLLQHIFPSPDYSPYIQPPALAQAAAAIFEKDGDTSFLREVLPRVKSYYLYLDRSRNPGDGLLEIIHPYESGRDRAREWEAVLNAPLTSPFWKDPLIRLLLQHYRLGWDRERIMEKGRFRVKDLMFNCIYARNLRELGRLLKVLGDPEAESFEKKAAEVEAAILAQMFDPESRSFYSLETRAGARRPLRVLNLTTFMTLLLESVPEEIVEHLADRLTDPGLFWPRYPVPVEPGDLPCEQTIWRGAQTWMYTNWLIFQGLLLQGRRFPGKQDRLFNIASELAARSLEMVERGGFREFYDSRTGEGKRAHNFGWSALVLDMVYNIV